MDIISHLREAGFDRVTVLTGSDCGIPEQTLLLAFMTYEAEAAPPSGGAWIHPYYYVSQRAYRAASALVRQAQAEGIPLTLRDEVRVKPIFARLPGMTQGRNTLSCLPEVGSRFHVQIFALDAPMTPSAHLEDAPHPLHCGSCTRCLQACPTGALDAEGFHREKCLRNWQLGGKPVPGELRGLMGNRLIGCDDCQRCCPHNPAPQGNALPGPTLASLLGSPKETAAALRETIGANLALPNRVLAQACLLAGCSGQQALSPLLAKHAASPSPAVAEHAAWACQALAEGAEAKQEDSKP